MKHLPKLYLLRHGETLWNTEKRMQGQLNSDLTPRGEAQAAAQGRILAAQHDIAQFDARFSPLGRAMQTARIALAPLNVDATVDIRLQEIGTGDWEGRTMAEVQAATPAYLDPTVSELMRYGTAPGGEGHEAVQDRVSDLLASLTGPTILVTHGITMTFLRGQILGLTIPEMETLQRLQGVVIGVEHGVETLLREHAPAA